LSAPGFASPSPLFFFIEGPHVVLTGWFYTLGMQWLACHIQQTVFDDLKDAKLRVCCCFGSQSTFLLTKTYACPKHSTFVQIYRDSPVYAARPWSATKRLVDVQGTRGNPT
jgi:hypothetical protein